MAVITAFKTTNVPFPFWSFLPPHPPAPPAASPPHVSGAAYYSLLIYKALNVILHVQVKGRE